MEMTNEDNMELMARYEDNYFDLAIVDPPYGIGFGQFNRTNKDSNGNRYKANKYKQGDWDNAIPKDEYFIELKRVSKNQIIWGGNYFPILWNNACKAFVFWDKDPTTPNYSDGELAWTSFDKLAKRYYYAWNGLADGVKGRNKKQKTIHPTQKPVKLYEWILMNYAKEGDKILDTHLGSGSIAIACHNLGYDLTACELDTEYYEAAMKRIEQHKQQIRIF